MLKKFLYILGFLMFASIIVRPAVVLGEGEAFSGKDEDVPYSSARVFSKIVSAAGMNPNADWGTSFGQSNEEDVGKDLYLMVYRKVNVDPQQKALKNIAAKYGMSETELNRILHGDYTQLFEKKKSLSQEEAQKKLSEIQQLFKEEAELQSLEANVKSAVEPSEIFANGDLEDSGFDLINDLDIIEKILFLKTHPIDIGAGYSSDDDSSDEPASADQGDGVNPPADVDEIVVDDSPVGSSSQGVKGSQESDSGTQESASAETLASDELDPNTCFAGDIYSDALSKFEKDAATDPKLKDGSDKDDSKKPGDEKTGSNSSALSASDDFFPVQPPPSTPPIEPAEAGDWLQEDICEDVFCLFIKSVTVPAGSSFSSSDNCIACHAEKINDVLKNVITHSLVPNKAPGNMMESGKCKKAMSTGFGSVSMNFYASPMPIRTPQNDDIIFGTNIEDDWYNYCNAVAFPFGCRKEKAPTDSNKVEYTLPPIISETVAAKVTAQTSENSSFGNVNADIQKGIDAYSLERSVGPARVDAGVKSDQGASFFGPIKTEMDNMNSYFINFSDILQSLHEKVDTMPGPQACTDLKSKKKCT
ncbi:hypothetical protein IT413_03875 [Candidatus Peregrinibacteria bacterium]|nr:hypothetical protein [Candidatus Peregrinibacteria bacterium]